MTVTSALSPISLTQFFYENGELVRPARLFFYHPTTLDRITVYQDAGLGVPHDSPVVTGGKGRCPPVYVGTEPYRVRIFDAHGALVEEIPLLEGATPPADGGGGGSGLLPEEQLQLIKTGDIVTSFSNGGARAGFVRANGMLIAHPSFGGVGYNIERQSADVENLFKWLWGQSAVNEILQVLPTRGANATDDWAAGKAIALPDLRGRSLYGLDMVGGTTGSAASDRLLGVSFPGGGSEDYTGSRLGLALRTLTAAQMPAHTHGVNGSPTGVTVGAAGTGIAISANYAQLGAAYTGVGVVAAAAGITVHANYTGITFTDPGHDHALAAQVAVDGSGGVYPKANLGFGGAYTDHIATGAYITDPSHTHPVTDNGHNHAISDPTHGHPQNPHTHGLSDPTHAHVVSDPWHAHTLTSTGGDNSFESVGPGLIVAFYIKL